MTYEEYVKMWEDGAKGFNKALQLDCFHDLHIIGDFLFIGENRLCGYSLETMYKEYCKEHNN